MERRTDRLSSDEGIGLVELMIAILVLGFILTALGSSLVTTLRTVHGNETLVQATAVHQETLESIVALPYELIGIYDGAAGYSASVTDGSDTYATVTLAVPAPPDLPDPRVPAPEQTINRGNRTFDLRTDIFMVDTDGVDGVDSKRIRTTVSWTEGSSARSTTFYALRTPVVDEIPDTFAQILFEPSPNVTQLDASGVTTEAIAVKVHFNQPASMGSISYPLADGSVGTAALGSPNGTATEWQAVIPLNTALDVGDITLELNATAATGTESVYAAVTLTVLDAAAPPPSTSFAIKDIVATPTPLSYINSTGLRCPFKVTVRVTGFLPDAPNPAPLDRVDVTFQYFDGKSGSANLLTSSQLTANYVSNDGIHGKYEITIPESADQYFRNNEPISITAFAQPENSTVQKSQTVSVPTSGSGSC